MALSVNIVTAEKSILEMSDVQKIVVPASDGQITILPSHTALMTSLDAGELTLYGPDGAQSVMLAGGFLQVVHDEVNVLADVQQESEVSE